MTIEPGLDDHPPGASGSWAISTKSVLRRSPRTISGKRSSRKSRTRLASVPSARIKRTPCRSSGEMITLYGTMVWLPTDGNNTPDFLTPLDSGGDVPVYTGYNITLDGPFNEYFTLDATNPAGSEHCGHLPDHLLVRPGAGEDLQGRCCRHHLGSYRQPSQVPA